MTHLAAELLYADDVLVVYCRKSLDLRMHRKTIKHEKESYLPVTIRFLKIQMI